ncbi:hypothetical protein [Cedecea davisae]|uniref:hypothetical protein n=1 Tax=Cedecea davisae TaxID=158484 RepID=UPI001D0B93D5|nr:hypothetical protein [Cedecea davisae]
MGDGISGVGRLSYTFARQNDPTHKTAVGAELRGVKNTNAQPGRLNIQQALSSDKILAALLAPNALQSGNYSVKVINNNEGEAADTTFQRSESVNTRETGESLAGVAFKQALSKALSELPSGENFISQKHEAARQDLMSDYQNKKGEFKPTLDGKNISERTANKFISALSGSLGTGCHVALDCVNDFLMIRKEIKDELSPDDREGIKKLNELTGKFISKIAKHGLGLDSYAAGSMKAGENGLRGFERICNDLVQLSNSIKKESGLTFNPELSMKVASALSGSGLSEAQCTEILTNNQDLFRNAIAEHADMHSSIPGLSLSSFKGAQTTLHHEAVALDLLNNRLSEILDNVPAADAGKNNGPAAGPGAQPAQITYNITIDNSIHSNINEGMHAGQPVNTDSGNINSEETPFSNTLPQAENASHNPARHAQTETENKSGSGSQTSDSDDAAVIEEPFTRQSAKVNSATIPSLRPEKPGAEEVSLVDGQEESRSSVRPNMESSTNTVREESQTVSHEEPAMQPPQPSTTRADAQAAIANADKSASADSEQPGSVKSEADSVAQQGTKAVKHPTVDASTSYFGSPGSSGARSTPSDATRNVASGNAGIGTSRGAQTEGVSSRPSTTQSATQTQIPGVDIGKPSAVRSQLAGTKSDVDSVAQQGAKAVKHPTVDASTSYFGSPGSSGARSTPSDAARNIASGNTGTGTSRGAQTDGVSSRPVTQGQVPGTGKGTKQPAQPLASGMQAPAEVHSRSGERAVLQPTPLRHDARVQNVARNNPDVAVTQDAVRSEKSSETSSYKTSITQQIARHTVASNQSSVKYPPVNTTQSYFGSPGSSGARSLPSDTVRANGNTGISRGMQTTHVEPESRAHTQPDVQTRQPAVEQPSGQRVGVQSRIGQQALLEASPLMNSARVHATVQKAPADAVMPNMAHSNTKPDNNTQSVVGVKHQPAKKHPPVNTNRSYLGSPGSSGARSVPSEFASGRNEAATRPASPAIPGKNAAVPKIPEERRPVGSQNTLMAENQPRREARKNVFVQRSTGQAAKKHPPVGTTNGYVGGPGSSAARGVPSDFARSHQEAGAIVVDSASKKGSVGEAPVRESHQHVGLQDTRNTVNQPQVEDNKLTEAKPQSTAAASHSSDRKLTANSARPGANVENTARERWGATYMEKDNQGYIGSRGSAQSTPLFNSPANKK